MNDPDSSVTVSVLKKGITRAEYDMHDRPVRVTFTIEQEVWAQTMVNDAARRVTPDDVREFGIDKMHAVLEGLAYSETDIAELVLEGIGEKLQQNRERHEEIKEEHLEGDEE